MIKRLLIIVLFSITYVTLTLSQDRSILYSQYQFNGLILNPAYAGRNEVFTFALSHRSQWIGFEGAPNTNTLTLHWPMKNIHTALGILGYQEQIGSRKYLSLYLNYAHRFQVGNGKLSLGLKGGFSSGRFDRIDLGDDTYIFNDNFQKYFLPNFGLGIYYYTRQFYAGASVPLILGYKDGGETVGLQIYHDFKKYSYYFTTGYSIPLNNLIKLQPSVLVHYEISYSIEPDFNINVEYKNIFIAGLSYRPQEAFVLLFNSRIGYQTRFGISYDFGLGALSNYHHGSFEISLQYEFGYKIKASDPGNF